MKQWGNIKNFWAENYGWVSASAIAGAGYLSIQWLKASELFSEKPGEASLWAWTPLAITSLSALVAIILVFTNKSYSARMVKVIFRIGFLFILFYTFLGSLFVDIIF